MQAKYLVEITDPHHHYVKVQIKLNRGDKSQIRVFMPSWSPGSYLMREYARHVRKLKVQDPQGRDIFYQKKEKGIWELDFDHEQMKVDSQDFIVSYEVYCHELTVRTSHIDVSHAFLHGPSYLMGAELEMGAPTIEFKFPALWSKLTTGLKDISDKREIFIYEAKNYDDLLDCPVEIGCHETDGFMCKDKPHHLAWYGQTYAHGRELKSDIQKIVEYISDVMGGVPYEQYVFMTHFKPNLYGGLEHSNSTALQFDGRKLIKDETYLQWLCLVSHEYFHTWNIKRIRPKELGPFDYTNENYTSMLWLVEGLTSFVDELFVYQAGLCSLEDYLKMQKKNFERYFQTPGRKFDSLEQSSFDAWIKLYRPDENSRNSTVSYYLKGGLVFSVLNIFYHQKGVSFQEFLKQLWQKHLDRPAIGLEKHEVLDIIEEQLGEAAAQDFDQMLATTIEIDFEKYYNDIGIEFGWKENPSVYLGAVLKNQEGKLVCESVELDSPAHQYGLNAGDEIIALNGLRVGMQEFNNLGDFVKTNETYQLMISRLGEIRELSLVFGTRGRVLEELKVVDEQKAKKALSF